MRMWTARTMTGFALAFAVFAAGSVSAQQAMVGQDVKSLAGRWVGWGTPTTGGNVPMQVQVEPDGAYTSTVGSSIGKGAIKLDGGKLMAEGHLATGTSTVEHGLGKVQLTVSSKDGKQKMTGVGRDQVGPYNFQLTKE
jgi:hypothetical protein